MLVQVSRVVGRISKVTDEDGGLHVLMVFKERRRKVREDL
jgi:hypothetical protein